jgi:hypothetical protein
MRVKMSLQTLKAVNMIVEINHSYENEYSNSVCFTKTKIVWIEPYVRYKHFKSSYIYSKSVRMLWVLWIRFCYTIQREQYWLIHTKQIQTHNFT